MKPPSFSVMSPLWMGFWAVFLSLSWLVPVGVMPWNTFPADTWSAFTLLGAALVLAVRGGLKLSWHPLPCLAGALVLVPWLQFSIGVLPFAGLAWMASAYMLGFLLALLMGARWEQLSPGQFAHAFFIATGVAAVASVGLQLYSWLDLHQGGIFGMGMWAMDGRGQTRPYANLGQPNQLATLLLWGLVACLWAYLHKVVGGVAAVVMAAFLLVGIAFTQSRAGLLGLTVMVLASWLWRGLWPSRHLPKVALALYAYVLSIPSLLRWLNEALLLEQPEVYVRVAQQGELRLGAWRLFLHAVLEQPWLGYGWANVGVAQITVMDRLAPLAGLFQSSHNLFLDLALWVGLPIALLVFGMLVWWFAAAFRAIRRPEDAALLLVLVAVGIHAMVEFPLQYAYFLLPVGAVMGVLNVRLGIQAIANTSRWVLSVLWLAGAVVLGVTVRDYLEVENSYGLLRLEQSVLGQGRPPLGGPPDVWVLTQMRTWTEVARYKPRAGMSQQELDNLRTITLRDPSSALMFMQAAALALNGHADEAPVWLKRLCKFGGEEHCDSARQRWQADARLAAIPWPGSTNPSPATQVPATGSSTVNNAALEAR